MCVNFRTFTLQLKKKKKKIIIIIKKKKKNKKKNKKIKNKKSKFRKMYFGRTKQHAYFTQKNGLNTFKTYYLAALRYGVGHPFGYFMAVTQCRPMQLRGLCGNFGVYMWLLWGLHGC